MHILGLIYQEWKNINIIKILWTTHAIQITTIYSAQLG